MRVRIGPNYEANIGSLDEIMKSSECAALIRGAGEQVAERARSLAPAQSGAYRDSITVDVDEHETRVVAHVGATVPYSGAVESKHSVMRRALG